MRKKDEKRDLLSKLRPEGVVRRGWILAGAGPARYGWGVEYASGKVEWLGKTFEEAVAKATER